MMGEKPLRVAMERKEAPPPERKPSPEGGLGPVKGKAGKQYSRKGPHQHGCFLCPRFPLRVPSPQPDSLELSRNSSYQPHAQLWDFTALLQSCLDDCGFSCPPKTAASSMCLHKSSFCSQAKPYVRGQIMGCCFSLAQCSSCGPTSINKHSSPGDKMFRRRSCK